MLDVVLEVGLACKYIVNLLVYRIEVFFFYVVLALETAAVRSFAVVFHMSHLVPFLKFLGLARVDEGNDFADINELSFDNSNQLINILFTHRDTRFADFATLKFVLRPVLLLTLHRAVLCFLALGTSLHFSTLLFASFALH